MKEKYMETSYQLRKIGLPASVEKVRNLYRISSDTTCIGRGHEVDIFLDSSIRKGLISRAHAQIIKSERDGEAFYEIFDTSLNGTYVNDVRIRGSVILEEGDTIAFGHLRGSLIEPGTLAPQKETEFLFKFEKCLHPDIKEEMVDLTENGNNSSVFMSPKSPTEANKDPLSGLTNFQSLEYSPVEKKMKMPPSEECGLEKKYFIDDEKDLKHVVDSVIENINVKEEAASDDSFICHRDDQPNDLGSGPVMPTANKALMHPREKVPSSGFPKTLNELSDRNMNNLEANFRDSNADIKIMKNKKGVKGKENWVVESEESEIWVVESEESEIESESESEYLEESDFDSEKSEEIPDDSSDVEFVPKAKAEIKKNKYQSVVISPPTVKQPSKEMNSKTQTENVNRRKKKSNKYMHDRCDAHDCKRPSGALKTITWVQCDDCDAWYHVSCSGLSVADAKKKNTIFRCGCL